MSEIMRLEELLNKGKDKPPTILKEPFDFRIGGSCLPGTVGVPGHRLKHRKEAVSFASE